jgi:hypothetical protein
MKKLLHLLILASFFSSCGVLTSDKNIICNCCDKSFRDVESAIACIDKKTDNKIALDNRLFLFAFVSKDVKKNQELGWNIITDKDIVSATKKSYLLIIQDVNLLKFPNQLDATELLEKIKHSNGEPYFVVTNQALSTFADWSINEKKDIVLDRLKVGIGP